VWLNHNTNLSELIDALLENTTVEEVCLLIHETFSEQPTEDILTLFQVLGGLPNLTKLLFNTYRFPFVATLPILAFTNLFKGAQNLVEFKLWRADLALLFPNDASSSCAFDELAEALVRSTALKEFRLIKCRLTEETRKVCTLDPLIQGLAKLPNLREIELSATKMSALGGLSTRSISQLFRSSSLVALSLRNFDLSEEAVLEIANSLLQHNVLNNCDHHPTHKLKESTRKCDHLKPTSIQSHSSQVKHLKLSGVGGAASMLAKPIREAFHNVLESNYMLETLFLFDERNLQAEIQFYLKLNRLGRSLLLERSHASQKEWIDILVQVSDDLDCLFYFLSMNPLLCSSQYHEDDNECSDDEKNEETSYGSNNESLVAGENSCNSESGDNIDGGNVDDDDTISNQSGVQADIHCCDVNNIDKDEIEMEGLGKLSNSTTEWDGNEGKPCRSKDNIPNQSGLEFECIKHDRDSSNADG
jgi:hypothetical protein